MKSQIYKWMKKINHYKWLYHHLLYQDEIAFKSPWLKKKDKKQPTMNKFLFSFGAGVLDEFQS